MKPKLLDKKFVESAKRILNKAEITHMFKKTNAVIAAKKPNITGHNKNIFHF
ncbi:hypothetical protein [Wolbachia endosymbiont of Litomosoides sigmodontis]|uniref:hypothetical protein n=1 Tax=Wolbachia endosymbiont of Litomosoides sigmodontis TaxID=80850 RepID=UPI001C554A0D|nr:hypothetical protein [Wolbachia endosymbiont of Litomosoides sigmodontis]